MRFCVSCGREAQSGDAFCAGCGKPLALPPPQDGLRKRQHPNGRRIGCFIVGHFIALVGVLAFFLTGKGCAEVSGELTVTGLPGGDARFVPELCRSGQHRSFFGVSLVRKVSGGALLAIQDPIQGKVVKVELPGPCGTPGGACPALELRPDRCTALDLVLERTNTEVNDIRLLDGHLTLDCALPEGVRVQGRFEFSNCD